MASAGDGHRCQTFPPQVQPRPSRRIFIQPTPQTGIPGMVRPGFVQPGVHQPRDAMVQPGMPQPAARVEVSATAPIPVTMEGKSSTRTSPAGSRIPTTEKPGPSYHPSVLRRAPRSGEAYGLPPVGVATVLTFGRASPS
jgi:hypothetical protein